MEPLSSVSLAGRIIELKDRGWKIKEIGKELGVPYARVKETLAQARSRSMDSRRIAECHELLLEMIVSMREVVRLLSDMSREQLERRMRKVEQRDLSRKLGQAVDRITPPPA